MFTDTQDRGFTKDVCRSMVAMLDVDHSGKLGFEEFRTLWNDIRKWRVNLLFSFKKKSIHHLSCFLKHYCYYIRLGCF